MRNLRAPDHGGTVSAAMKGNVWEIVRTADGTFELFHNGELLSGSIQIGGSKISLPVMASVARGTATSVGN